MPESTDLADQNRTAASQRGGRARRSSLSVLKSAITIGLIAYAVIAVAGNHFAKHKEWFPVFSWSLFSEVYSYGWATRLEIVAINGQALAEPDYYRNLSDVFPNTDKASISLNKLLKTIAFDHAEGAPNKGRLRALKDNYLSQVDSVDWRIVRLVTDPIDCYTTGAVAQRYVWLEGSFPADRAE
jgi:hypothetical protein